MVIYEVNLTVNNSIFHEYYEWLMHHIKDMLQFRGFQKAEVAKEITNEDDVTKLAVRYTLENEQALESYLNHHAQAMRQDGIQRFGNQFSASRRVFIDAAVIG